MGKIIIRKTPNNKKQIPNKTQYSKTKKSYDFSIIADRIFFSSVAS